MSHFTVLVVDTNNEKSVDEWMEPFYEGLEKDRISDWGVQDTLKYLKDHNVDFPYDYVNETNLEEYLAVVKNEGFDISEHDNEGNLYYFGNKDAKWDWYQIGGRWSGMLKKLDGTRCDECEVKDLDLSLDKDMYEKAERFWEVVVDKRPLKDGEYADGFISWYKDSYYKDTFGDKETFAKDKASLSTLAMLLDGKWYEQGKMGWFGMSDTTSDSLKEYTKFFNKTLEELKQTHPHATVTLVDCHI
jgi:hypothetical protein